MAKTTTKVTPSPPPFQKTKTPAETKGSKHQTQTLRLNGKITSGKREGTKLTQLPWVKKQIRQKIGFTPHPGTLNITLTKESTKLKQQLQNTQTTELTPNKEDYCTAKLFKAKITDHTNIAVIIPQINNYPKNLIEIIAPTNLRNTLNLRDKDTITITITSTNRSYFFLRSTKARTYSSKTPFFNKYEP